MADALQSALWVYGCLTLLLLISTLGLWYERRQFAKRTGCWSSSPAWYIVIGRALTWPLWLPVYCVRTVARPLYATADDSHYEHRGEVPAVAPVHDEPAPVWLAIAGDAQARSRQLLIDHLDDDQRVSYLAANFFDVTTKAGHCYRLFGDHGDSFNVVHQYWANGVIIKLCCRPNAYLPDGDRLLAQMMLLLTDEARFLRLSNFSVQIGNNWLPTSDGKAFIESLARVAEERYGD